VRRHEVDVVSLVFGLFFVGAAAIGGLPGDATDAVRGGRVPLLLIVVGLIGLLASLSTRRSRSQTAEPVADQPVAPAATDAPGEVRTDLPTDFPTDLPTDVRADVPTDVPVPPRGPGQPT